MGAFVTLLTVATLLCSVIALPASTCATVTSEVIVPTTTYTFSSTFVTTERQSTPHLGTWTEWVVVPETKTLRTLTTTTTDCTAYGTVKTTAPVTVYPTPQTSAIYPALAVRGNSEQPAPSCTVTTTVSTTVGATWVYVAANQTSTFTEYTAWSMETISSTTSTGTTYMIATATTKTCQMCGPTTTLASNGTTQPTTTYDARCLSPTSAASAAASTGSIPTYGFSYLDDHPGGGALFRTTTSNPQACCQLCVEQSGCAGSAWDIRSNECRLEFPVGSDGNPSCGAAAQAYYDFGPVHPMAPGTGWYLSPVCGRFDIANAKPDDGT
ncbi:hypothetical protein AMS68_006758 [Peltaster fructicola]|uniref:Apple domain-containing protein n=1 Tax=Peltaster fructicola TaxID=286661 RepID=A0A6H0Y2V5_9PEZI|nr:hypothetical protein AMS68_006758 [Peltaster fructicola]